MIVSRKISGGLFSTKNLFFSTLYFMHKYKCISISDLYSFYTIKGKIKL